MGNSRTLGDLIYSRGTSVVLTTRQNSTLTGLDIFTTAFAASAGKRYLMIASLWINVNAASGIKFAIIGPSDAVLNNGIWDGSSTTAAGAQEVRAAAINTFTGTAFSRANIPGSMAKLIALIDVVTAGNLNIQFTPGTAGDLAKVESGSWMFIQETL